MSSSKPKTATPDSCQLCGARLPSGSLKYILKLEIWADFDGHLEEEDPRNLKPLLKKLEEANPVELEEEVHCARYFLICASCRGRILSGPKNQQSAESQASHLH